MHSIILIEPGAWHENKTQIMLLTDGGDGPAATIYPTAILINSYPVTCALTGMNKLTWWLWYGGDDRAPVLMCGLLMVETH